MPTSKQKRQAAQRHLQRQLERRAELAKKRRQRNIVLAAALSVLVVLGAVFLITTLGGDDEATDPAASPTTSPPVDPTATTEATTAVPGACTFIAGDPAAPNVTDVGLPPTPAETTGTVELSVATNQGDMVFTLDRASAPCAVQSVEYLASQGFYDDSPCHRLVNQDAFGVLQCGDPSGTGTGGPGYAYAQEAPAGETPYAAGVIAMANSGSPNSTSSQFFIMFQDTDLPPEYSVVGTVTSGLEVVETVAAAGNDGSFEPSPGGGAPNLPITIKTMTPVS
ncbi:MAG: peptidylprolyl isomerase [Geodermatophilaceae bacterium]|nr:peptidylprolyl isomerase [Geodermatophilaceae bacterium]MDQ3463716.1 peptidylprolyl isomerase [Actinomycetota bacterium]